MTTNRDRFLLFSADLTRLQGIIGNNQNAVVRNIAVALAENIIVGGRYGPGTPIDTSFARNSWYMSYNTPGPTKPPTSLDGSGQTALGEIGLLLVGVRAGGVIYIMNGTTYIRALEYGHSKQAPAGMVRIVLTNAQALVSGVVREMQSRGAL